MGEQRLIDANELKTAFPCGESVRTECVRATIDQMPTIEERKKGKWIDGLKCSHCGQVDTTIPNFCPNCGADMRGTP